MVVCLGGAGSEVAVAEVVSAELVVSGGEGRGRQVGLARGVEGHHPEWVVPVAEGDVAGDGVRGGGGGGRGPRCGSPDRLVKGRRAGGEVGVTGVVGSDVVLSSHKVGDGDPRLSAVV